MEITTARVVNSTQLELVLLSYEIIIDDIEKNILAAKDSRKVDLTNAKNFLRNLRDAVDKKYDLSKRLISIYDYVSEILTKCEITTSDERREETLTEAKSIITRLYDS